MVKIVETLSEFNSIVKGSGNKLVVVDFTATWCGPCQRIAPLFAEMAEEMKDVIFIKVDVDQNEETASSCNINAMPTFQFYKNGQKLEEFSGADINKLKQTSLAVQLMPPSSREGAKDLHIECDLDKIKFTPGNIPTVSCSSLRLAILSLLLHYLGIFPLVSLKSRTRKRQKEV
ncbi:hypothetical protein ACJMK2_041970 [Sinanodonta woodiana]|uniref:Thioredoxin domain-containing protein n=1 Tax=Sinanodonta woodiana TaxID=1069815 RepID=A0ABD3W6J9_SINWO